MLNLDHVTLSLEAINAYQTQFGEAPPDRLTSEDEDDLSNFTPDFKRLMGSGLSDEQLQKTWETLTIDLRSAFK